MNSISKSSKIKANQDFGNIYGPNNALWLIGLFGPSNASIIHISFELGIFNEARLYFWIEFIHKEKRKFKYKRASLKITKIKGNRDYGSI